MQAAGIDAFGGEVHLLELAAPGSPAPDELLISVRAAGVGNWDEIVRVGEWDIGRKPPLALSVEATGVVAAVGEDVTGFALGDEVLTHPHPLPLRHQGAWAQLLAAPAALVAPKPAAVPWETAAAFPVPALTAEQALSEAAPSPAGEWVLVHGAGGVTGGLLVQLAVARGATVVATAGPSSESRVRDYGARVVLDYHDPDWAARVRDASPGGRGVGAAVTPLPAARRAPYRQSRTMAGWRRSPAIHRHPNEESRSRTSTSKPTANGWLHWPKRSKTACCCFTWGRHSRWPTRRLHFKSPSPAGPPAPPSSHSTQAPSGSARPLRTVPVLANNRETERRV